MRSCLRCAVGREGRPLVVWLMTAACCAGHWNISHAQVNGYYWSVTPTIGIHAPELEALNERGLKAPLFGTGSVTVEGQGSGETENQERSFGFSNPLDNIDRATNAGLEFQWWQSPKHIFLMGMSSWEGTSRGRTGGSMPIQNALRDVTYERRVKISYNEFSFGWKYLIKHRPNKYLLYSRISLNELFDVDLRDELVFTINEPGSDLDQIKRVTILKAQTTGLLMLQLGMGAEYFLKKNVSIGMEAGWLAGERSFEFRNLTDENNRVGNDNYLVQPPMAARGTGLPLGTRSPNIDPHFDWTSLPNNAQGGRDFPAPQDMRLRFDGWKAMFRISLYY